MGFMLADRALIWCTICIFLNVSLYSLLPKRLGDRKHRLEFAQRVTSSLHAIWMFTGAVHCWAFGKCTLNNGADIFKGYTRIAELSPLIDDRIDHMLGYLIADQVRYHPVLAFSFSFSISHSSSGTRYFNRFDEIQLVSIWYAACERVRYNGASRPRHGCPRHMPSLQPWLVCALHLWSLPCGRFDSIFERELDYEKCRFGSHFPLCCQRNSPCSQLLRFSNPHPSSVATSLGY